MVLERGVSVWVRGDVDGCMRVLLKWKEGNAKRTVRIDDGQRVQ